MIRMFLKLLLITTISVHAYEISLNEQRALTAIELKKSLKKKYSRTPARTMINMLCDIYLIDTMTNLSLEDPLIHMLIKLEALKDRYTYRYTLMGIMDLFKIDPLTNHLKLMQIVTKFSKKDEISLTEEKQCVYGIMNRIMANISEEQILDMIVYSNLERLNRESKHNIDILKFAENITNNDYNHAKQILANNNEKVLADFFYHHAVKFYTKKKQSYLDKLIHEFYLDTKHTIIPITFKIFSQIQTCLSSITEMEYFRDKSIALLNKIRKKNFWSLFNIIENAISSDRKFDIADLLYLKKLLTEQFKRNKLSRLNIFYYTGNKGCDEILIKFSHEMIYLLSYKLGYGEYVKEFIKKNNKNVYCSTEEIKIIKEIINKAEDDIKQEEIKNFNSLAEIIKLNPSSETEALIISMAQLRQHIPATFYKINWLNIISNLSLLLILITSIHNIYKIMHNIA